VAIFKARSNDDLTILRAGMCPDCGASVYQGITACGACGLSFQNNLGDLPPRKAPAAPAPRPAQAPPPAAAPQHAPPPAHAPQAPPPMAMQQPPPAAAQAPAQGGRPRPPPSATPIDPSTWAKPLSLDDIMEIERGPLRANDQPLTDAEGPDVVTGDPAPLLGSSLSRAAIVVMADAAVCDDPMVLLGYPPVDSHVARAMINLRRGEAATIDDPEVLVGSRDVAEPKPAAPKRGPSSDAVIPDRAAQAPAGGLFTGPGVGKPLTLEDIERIERPYELEQPHSFAEITDLEGGVGDPLLGAALIRGGNASMADAAVTDEPLVLLGYPPVVPRDVPRLAVNLRRGDAALVDEIESLLQRGPVAPAPAQAAAQPAQPARPAPAAPAAPVAPAAPAAAAPRRPPQMDPEATALLDQAAVRAAQAAVAREQAAAQAQAQQPNRVASRVHGRGAVQSLDD
jgi:hypothetical protein